MRIDRMLAITVMLLNRDRISARELADKFEVSIRTVYRDIEAINMAGIPIISYTGSSGGFGIMENYKIDRQLLTLSDMLAILTALKGINTSLEDKELDSAIEKISSLVPKEKSEEMKLHFEKMVIDILPWGYTDKQKDKVKIIQNAISDNFLINITYTSLKEERLKRTIEPMTLIMKGYSWYLFAFCRERNDYRFFRVSRIKSLNILEQKFKRREASYTSYNIDDNPATKIANLVLKFSSKIRVKVEDYFNEEQLEFLKNGDIIVRISWPEDEWVYSFILSYGEYIEVLEPPHIKKILREKAKKILQKYT